MMTKKIYIGFSKPNEFKIFAWIIQLIEKRQYDHVYIRVEESCNNTAMIFQASSIMVNLRSETMFLDKNVSLKEYEINITDEQYAQLWNFINANLGLPYSLSEDFGLLLMKIFKLKDQPFNQGKTAYFCSKLGASVCNLLNIQMPDDIADIDPSDLDTILSEKGFSLYVKA